MQSYRYVRAFMFASMIPVLVCATSAVESKEPERLALLRDKVSRRQSLSQLDQALLDAADVLERDSGCASFYRNPRAALTVLISLVDRLHIEPMANVQVGVKMSGRFTNHVEPETGISFRLFQHSALNLDGPFFRTKEFAKSYRLQAIGSYGPNTREARLLMLLHELGHLMTDADGAWLLPDDGNDAEQSKRNSLIIEARCREQLSALKPSR